MGHGHAVGALHASIGTASLGVETQAGLGRETVDKLVRVFGYPPSLFDLEFDYGFMCRGLIVDKRRGNVIKASMLGGLGHGSCKPMYGTRRV